MVWASGVNKPVGNKANKDAMKKKKKEEEEEKKKNLPEAVGKVTRRRI